MPAAVQLARRLVEGSVRGSSEEARAGAAKAVGDCAAIVGDQGWLLPTTDATVESVGRDQGRSSRCESSWFPQEELPRAAVAEVVPIEMHGDLVAAEVPGFGCWVALEYAVPGSDSAVLFEETVE